jgi:tRNA G18 (ribose-2'-O)-methylase SpoU
MDRGFFMIGVVQPRNTLNIGTLIRSSHVFGATAVFAVGAAFPVENEAAHGFDRHVPVFHFDDVGQFDHAMPKNAEYVVIEMHEDACDLRTFVHPERGIYILGSEYMGVPAEYLALRRRTHIVQVPARESVSLNVAIAGSIVMADRVMKEEGRQARQQMFRDRSSPRPERDHRRKTPPPDPA